MTTLAQANEAIAELFVQTWSVTTFAYSLDNESYDPPDDAPWARFSVVHTGSTQDTIGRPGNRKFERSGSAFVQVFVKSDTGTQQSKELTQTVMDGFEGVSISGTSIYFLDVIPRETGTDRGWFQTVVEATFRYFETK